jgi:anthraniloyl-CoA monooxygenase
MTEDDMDRIEADFVAASRRADAAGFDMIELQAGHGFLLSSFITPIMNRRADAYGGGLEDRMRFPLRVVRAVRAAWPAAKPLAVRISATDWSGEQGVTADEAVKIARLLVATGADLIDVSTGETNPEARPVYGRMFQTPYADQIRNEVGCPTMTVGNIYEADHANSILAAGRADLVALGRPHLINPSWTLHAAAAAGYRGMRMPVAYRPGEAQLERNLGRAAVAGG